MINIIVIFMVYCGCGLLFTHNGDSTLTRAPWQKTIGESFFMGVFVIVLGCNLLQLLKLDVSPQSIWMVYVLFAIAAVVYKAYRNRTSVLNQLSKINISSIYVLATLVIVALHFYYIVRQNQSLPLTPWDAWNGWIAKAKIWYFHGINENLVNRVNWLVTDGNFTNPTAHYPDALPLLYVFNSGFFGWQETSLNAIYPAMFVAFLLAFFGHLKQLTDGSFALIAVLILATVPFINVHVALSGYADIWIAALLVLILLNAQHFLSRPDFWVFMKILSLLLTLVMFKLESWVWLSIFVLTFGLCLVNPLKRKWLYFLIISVSIVWYLFSGFSINMPFGELVISPSLIKIPALGSYGLAFVNTTSAWLEALFFSKNWGFLWYTIPFVIVMCFKLKDKNSVVLPALYLLFTVFFLYVLFYMTYASVFANDFTSSNRIVLHIVPLYIYFAIQVIYQYHRQSLKLPS